MTIKDLFIQKQSYIVDHKLNDNYYIYIEALTENGEAIQEEEFNEYAITPNTCIELHEYGIDDSICEWYSECQFEVWRDLEGLEEVMKHAIRFYEEGKELWN